MIYGLGHSAQATQESWYWGFDLGWSNPNYDNPLNTAVDSLSLLGASRTSIGSSLRIYWPIETGETVIGVASTSILDRFSYLDSSISFG